MVAGKEAGGGKEEREGLGEGRGEEGDKGKQLFWWTPLLWLARLLLGASNLPSD